MGKINVTDAMAGAMRKMRLAIAQTEVAASTIVQLSGPEAKVIWAALKAVSAGRKEAADGEKAEAPT